jgi:methyl-accepting chemotaxis protein
MHAAAGTLPDPGRIEKIEQDTDAALQGLAAFDPESAARSRELISTAQKKARLLLMASAEEPEFDLPAPEPEVERRPPPRAPPARAGKGKKPTAPAPPPPAPRTAAAPQRPVAAPGAEGRIAALYAEAETFLAAQHTARRARMEAEIARADRDANVFAGLVTALVAAGLAVTALVFVSVRRRVLRPLQALAALARRVSAEQDLTVQVPVTGDDELQELARAFAELMDTLRRLTVDLRRATDRLLDAARHLGGATRTQADAIARQASALEEARRTSGLLQDSAHAAADQAGGVLRVAEKADALTQAGSAAVAASLSGVAEVRQHTEEVAGGLAALVESARQIGDITALVKDLADQSNVLALNATLEASRAGAAGAGFAVVAREIRHLADRSLGATRQVRTVLGTVLGRIRDSAVRVEAAQGGLLAGAGSTQRLGESLAGLAGIVRENLGAAREISGAVTRQGAGITQITAAVDDLSQLMQETLQSVGVTEEAAGVLHEVSGQVSTALKAFRV